MKQDLNDNIAPTLSTDNLVNNHTNFNISADRGSIDGTTGEVISSPSPSKSTFLALELPQIQWAHTFLEVQQAANTPSPQILSLMISELVSRFGFTPEAAQKTAPKVIAYVSSPAFTSRYIELNKTNPSNQLTLTTYDLSLLKDKLIAAHEHDSQVISLLLSFLAIYRHTYHPSNKIRYDKKQIFYLAGLSHLKVFDQEKLTQYLHSTYTLEMQVVGSNNPIPCFSFPWLVDQPIPGLKENRYVNHGPLLPESIQALSKIVLSQISPKN